MAHRVFGSDVYHPDLRRYARVLPSRPFLGPRTAGLMQRNVNRLPKRDDVPGTQVTATSSVRIHRPPGVSAAGAALLWIHGGGFVMGSARQDDEHCAVLARDAGILVAAVNYRLAPQHPYPAALNDCYDALTWLARQPDVDPNRIAIGGASAGAGLAAAVALMARDRGGIGLAFQLLSYPMLDDRTAARTDPDHGLRRLWDNKANAYAWTSYLGHAPGSARVDPFTAPARSTDLGGLPPTWIGVGSVDLFYDEDVDYGNRLQEAGVECSLDIVDGAFHGFDVLRSTPVARQFQSQQSQVLRAALSP